MRISKLLGVFVLALGLSWSVTPLSPANALVPEDLCATVGNKAGFPRSALVTAVAVALAESSCNPSASNTNNNGTIDRGLWQINSIHPYSSQCLFDAQCNANAAFAISSGGTKWKPWVTYNTGAYQKHLERAQAAVDRLTASERPVDRTVGDVTGDAFSDLTAVDAEGRLVVYANGIKTPAYGGKPFMSRTWATKNTGWNSYARSITTADVTGDGFADLLTLTSQGRLDIYPNGSKVVNGDYFTNAYWTYDNWGNYTNIAAGDVNRDGFADLAATTTDGHLHVYLNTKETGSTAKPFRNRTWDYTSGWGNDVIDIAIGDATGDGYGDLLAIRTNGYISMFANGIKLSGQDRPFKNLTWSANAAWDHVRDITVSDITGDGFADLMAITDTGDLQIYANGSQMWNGSPYKGSSWIYKTWDDVRHIA